MRLIDERVSALSMKMAVWPCSLKILMLNRSRLRAIMRRSCASAGYRETFWPLLPLNEDDFGKSPGTKIHIGSHPM